MAQYLLVVVVYWGGGMIRTKASPRPPSRGLLNNPRPPPPLPDERDDAARPQVALGLVPLGQQGVGVEHVENSDCGSSGEQRGLELVHPACMQEGW